MLHLSVSQHMLDVVDGISFFHVSVQFGQTGQGCAHLGHVFPPPALPILSQMLLLPSKHKSSSIKDIKKQPPQISCFAADALSAAERKVVAVATKLVTCPALLLLDQPLSPFKQPQHAASAAHLVRSLRTAASQLRMNIIIAEQGLQDAAFGAVDNVVMLDEQALPVYAGTSKKASPNAAHAHHSIEVWISRACLQCLLSVSHLA